MGWTEFSNYAEKLCGDLPPEYRAAKAVVTLYEHNRLAMKKSPKTVEKAIDAINSYRMRKGQRILYAPEMH